MSKSRRKRLVNRKRRIQYRLRNRAWSPQDEPMLTARNIQYELSDRIRGLSPGGIGAIHLLARKTGLIDAIDEKLHLLKVHLPYHESDHVLNIAYNILSGGTCLDDIELRRNDEVYPDALVSNWAYMVMASLAWTLKAWFALCLPETGRWADKYRAEKQAVQRMEFKKFVNAFIHVPCQIVRTGRRIVYRLLAWNPWQYVFLRGVDALRYPLRC